MLNPNWMKKLTPEQAWNEFVTVSVELFISNFNSEGITDITDACKRYSRDIPCLYDRPFMQNQLDHIARLLEQYIDDYLEKMGGFDKLSLYTEEDLDEMDEEDVRDLLELVEEFRKRKK
jgi:hypothetical protein